MKEWEVKEWRVGREKEMWEGMVGGVKGVGVDEKSKGRVKEGCLFMVST